MIDSSEIKPHILLLDFFRIFSVYKPEWIDDIYVQNVRKKVPITVKNFLEPAMFCHLAVLI